MTSFLIYSKIFYILKIQFLNLGQHGQQKNKIASAKLARLFEDHLIEKKVIKWKQEYLMKQSNLIVGKMVGFGLGGLVSCK